jgi:uncharacterized protein YgiM (DUF1202 family)
MIKKNGTVIYYFLLGLSFLVLISACGVPAATQETQPKNGEEDQVVQIEKKLVVIADRATLRSGPGVSFDNIGSLERDTVVDATAQTLDGDWYRIRMAEGSSGEAWISAEFAGPAEITHGNVEESPTLMLADTTTPSPTAAGLPTLVSVDTPASTTTSVPALTFTPLPTSGPPMIAASIATNCRAGTSKIFDVLGWLEPGDAVEVRGRSPDGLWWYIQNPDRPDRTCWIWAETTTVSGDLSQIAVVKPPPTPTLTLAPPDTPTVTTTIVPPDTPTPSSTVISVFTPTQSPSDTPVPTDTAVPSP